jgi:hypothetical protein
MISVESGRQTDRNSSVPAWVYWPIAAIMSGAGVITGDPQ